MARMGQGHPPMGPGGSEISGEVAWEKLVLLLTPGNLFGTAQELPDYCRSQRLIPPHVYPGVTPEVLLG